MERCTIKRLGQYIPEVLFSDLGEEVIVVPVEIDYSKDFEDMIISAGLKWDHITEMMRLFGFSARDYKKTVEMCLWRFTESRRRRDWDRIFRDEVLYELNHHGMSPGNLQELLALVNEYPEIAKDFRIIAPIPMCATSEFASVVPDLRGKTLSSYPDIGWGLRSNRFLATPKEHWSLTSLRKHSKTRE